MFVIKSDRASTCVSERLGEHRGRVGSSGSFRGGNVGRNQRLQQQGDSRLFVLKVVRVIPSVCSGWTVIPSWHNIIRRNRDQIVSVQKCFCFPGPRFLGDDNKLCVTWNDRISCGKMLCAHHSPQWPGFNQQILQLPSFPLLGENVCHRCWKMCLHLRVCVCCLKGFDEVWSFYPVDNSNPSVTVE